VADEVMTLEEVAAFLKIGETTAYQLARAGQLPGRKVGREWRFLRDRVLDWLEQGGEDTPDGPPDVIQRDQWGGEFVLEGGQEMVALWLPMTREEKGRQIEKAVREGMDVSDLVLNYLRDWMKQDSAQTKGEPA
jgi:excisionase family DNA binding protein